MDNEARHGVDIDNLWDSLHHATCNLDMIDMTHYKMKHDLPDLIRRIRNRIQITEHHLREMTPPIQNPTQEDIYRKYIKRI